MDATTVFWLALAVFVGQGVLVGAVLWLVRSFGAYTSIVLQTHNQNMLVQQELFNQADDLARLRAQLLVERAKCHKKPSHSEDAVA